MDYSAANSQPDGGPRRSDDQEPSEPSSAAAEAIYRALLDAVVQQTLLAESSQLEHDREACDALLDVARRRQGEPFACDPVGIEMVASVLRVPFLGLMGSDAQWEAMTQQVAQTLCEDPASYDRLKLLWNRLEERCRNGN